MSAGNGEQANGTEEYRLDDDTVEELLTGGYSGKAKDLVTLARALAAMSALADEPAPAPSPALQHVLNGDRRLGADTSTLPVTGPELQPRSGLPWSRDRRRWVRWVPTAAIATGLAAIS